MTPAAERNVILKSLMGGAHLTAKDALHLCGCWQMHKRIKELRDADNKISQRYIRNARGTHISVYFMAE